VKDSDPKPKTTTFDVGSVRVSTIEDVDSQADDFIRSPGRIHQSTLRRIVHGKRKQGWYRWAMLGVAVVAAVAAVLASLRDCGVRVEPG